ncbi:hypothetical protein DCAR_0935443 [Daucus carota subsp. sativus]|uniref:Uncharacterized protein n=1 Tax=Daucus carota subsp. sativus TaxID=79200 RepID=A0AAF0XX46_DAUCS|nr:PREDICTED: uncharacterized protein LOC108201589 [Daucus carota subsp. sativus]WOH15896.1 hypothetical protein DCAR_0935443 [Daucus carota subsp. sativus]
MVMEGVQEDYACSMQCTKHTYQKNSPAGGICVFCLQEKLGKLAVSSSFPLSNTTVNFNSSSSSSPSPPPFTSSKKSRIPFLSSKKKNDPPSSSAPYTSKNIIFNRSKSSVMPRAFGPNFTETSETDGLKTPQKSRFWKLAHFSQRQKHKQLVCLKKNDFRAIIENESPLNCKITRSRSVGCGSLSFSGDFFGDCVLRRVESQREVKPRERVNKWGGLFSGFGIGTRPEVQLGQKRSRSWSWSWALPSPIMGFRPSYSRKRHSLKKEW